jgi:RES domain
VSSNIWMPRAVASEAFRAQRRLWRAVAAQHLASTLRLVANAAEHLLLEKLLEETKPALAAGSADLHYLLGTPFRHASPIGSRFRAPAESGIWYGAEAQRTACAELGFWRWRFLVDSAGLESLGPSPHTVFQAGIHAQMVDLTAAPFMRSHAEWAHPDDYGPTQRFAHAARAVGVDAIRYESVRDPRHGAAVAVLQPSCFKPRKSLQQATWFLTVRAAAVIWLREGQTFEFDAREWRRLH